MLGRFYVAVPRALLRSLSYVETFLRSLSVFKCVRKVKRSNSGSSDAAFAKVVLTIQASPCTDHFPEVLEARRSPQQFLMG